MVFPNRSTPTWVERKDLSGRGSLRFPPLRVISKIRFTSFPARVGGAYMVWVIRVPPPGVY
jgi:hypothetical protein